MASKLESDLRDAVNWDRKWLIDFSAGLGQSNKTGASDMKMGGSVLEEKWSFKMLELSFSSKLNWGSYIVAIAKTASKKIETLMRCMKCFSPELALFLY